MESTQTTVAVAVALLASVFALALFGLILICRQRLCSTGKKRYRSGKEDFDTSPDIHLISSLEHDETDDYPGVIDPEDFLLHPELDKIVEAYRWKWVDDALGLIPHCLALLKGCHFMSERIVTSAMATTDQKQFNNVALVAKAILPLVDDMLRCMCPPIDPRLVVVRAGALVNGLTHLASLTEKVCNASWPKSIMSDINSNYQRLQDIAEKYEQNKMESVQDETEEDKESEA